MKAGGRLVLLVCALAALLALPAGAIAAAGKGAGLQLSSFKLQGTNDYELEVFAVREGDFPATVGVIAQQGPLQANYDVRAEFGAGIRATFGSLGQVDVSFERRRKHVERPEPGCTWITERGVFRGSFRFVGEGAYTSAEAVDPRGEVIRLPNGFCGFEDFRPARLRLPGLHQTVLAAQSEAGNGTVSFTAARWNVDKLVSFNATLRERVGQMKIERSAQAQGGERTFSSTKGSRATVRPPWPFRGSARFRDPGKNPPRWTGSLSVSFPGAPNIALAGKGFKAKLCARLPVLAKCR
jgi:hypothetical protein